jgi:hypothetical protein
LANADFGAMFAVSALYKPPKLLSKNRPRNKFGGRVESPTKSWRASGRLPPTADAFLELELELEPDATAQWNNAIMKPRLFSTLRVLQHENPLVCI